LGDTGNVVGADNSFFHDLAEPFFTVLNVTGGEFELRCDDILMTPGRDEGEGEK
jgi:hypothetical protein